MIRLADARYETYIDAGAGTVDRAIFSDPDIYAMEQKRIFARAWNFMCHESQIAKPGDFFLNYIGEESVIATRDRTGKLQVFLNSCRHRGNSVCRAESGNTRSFLCTYHGWTYGLDGKLMGVPGYRELYHEDLDRAQWGLISAAKVESYKGFVFANMDPDAPDLEDFLGEVGRIGLDLIAERGDIVAVEGVQKNRMECNWKIAVDNLFDWYHVDISHASAMMAGFIPRAVGPDPDDDVRNMMGPRNHRVVLGSYGHAISGPRLTPKIQAAISAMVETGEPLMPNNPLSILAWREGEKGQSALGPVGADVFGHPSIFPNLWVASFGTQLGLRLPKGPNATEVWWFTFVDKNLPEQQQAMMINRASKGFGPAGMLEQDDGENWEQSSRASQGEIGRRYPLNYQMNLGRGQVTRLAEGPGFIDTHVSEHAQLWTYRAWSEWMDATSWDALRQHHSPPPANAA